MCKIQNISDNPFARFSAEEEEDLRSIFVKPRYYDALKSTLDREIVEYSLGKED